MPPRKKKTKKTGQKLGEFQYPVVQKPPPGGFEEEAKVFKGESPCLIKLHEDSMQYIFRFGKAKYGVSVISYTNKGSTGNWDALKIIFEKDGSPKHLPVESDDWDEDNDISLDQVNEFIQKIKSLKKGSSK